MRQVAWTTSSQSCIYLYPICTQAQPICVPAILSQNVALMKTVLSQCTVAGQYRHSYSHGYLMCNVGEAIEEFTSNIIIVMILKFIAFTSPTMHTRQLPMGEVMPNECNNNVSSKWHSFCSIIMKQFSTNPHMIAAFLPPVPIFHWTHVLPMDMWQLRRLQLSPKKRRGSMNTLMITSLISVSVYMPVCHG